MPLAPGTRFGPFEIAGLIGAGGMGEVYRARDTKLDRDVALKVLPAAFTGDPERLVRFEREAKTLASLNHPHIAHVYGLEDASATATSAGPLRALVMELVEGDDLAQRIARGSIPVADVVPISRQIVDAIASAHEKGIIHRDLKPANIKVTPDGTVKVLDFGLAKALTSDPTSAESAPTITSAGTLKGAILGTAAYMSPEQARGQAVDSRTDVWAFGCVLYEMLAGRPAFPGATTSDTIAKILEREPNWEALPSSTPPSLRRLLTRCLEKDPKRRLHAIADAQFEIDEALVERSSGAKTHITPTPVRIGRWPLAAAVGAILLAVAVWRFWPLQTVALPAAHVMALTSYPGFEATPSFSPDGKQIAFSWDGEKADNEDIYVVIVGSDSPLRVTRDEARDISPAWKPDGSQIAFIRLGTGNAAIYLVSPLGESEQKLAEFLVVRQGSPTNEDPLLSWSPDGRWLAVSRMTAGDQSGLFLLAADGSTRHLLLPAKAGSVYDAAAFSPQGDALGYVNTGYIEVVGIEATDPPTITEAPRRLTSRIGSVNGLAWTVDGTALLFGQGQVFYNDSHLWRVPVSGGRAPERIDLAGIGAYPAISKLQNRLAFSRRSFNLDLHILEEGREPRTIVPSTFNEYDASLSADGSKVAFTSDRTGEGSEIWVASAADGSGRRSVSKGAHRPSGSPRWSPDGRRILFDGIADDGKAHLYVVDEAGGQAHPIASKPGFNDQIPSWSRDGRWIYFGSDRTGRMEVWRAPAGGGGGDAQQLTTTGGGAPVESWDGRTLYFSRPTEGGRVLLAMPVAGGPERSMDIITTFWNYRPAEHGLYYVPLRQGKKAPYNYEVRFLDFATGKSRLLYSVRLAVMGPGLSVLADGKTVLVSGVAAISSDLMRIENFR
jgi:serine/threonine protein kinase